MKDKKFRMTSLGAVLFALLMVFVFSANVRQAWSYFTTFATAAGGYTIQLGDETSIEEEYHDKQKDIRIVNNAKSNQPVYVRARAFWGSQYDFEYRPGANWKKAGDVSYASRWRPTGDDNEYYYYDVPLAPGESSEPLTIYIGDLPGAEDDDSQKNINVAVIYEATPVLYEESGKPYADWNMKFEITHVQGN